MEHVAAMPEVYTELVDAIVEYETDKARKFTFGSRDCWVPKSVSKMIEMRLYVMRTVAAKKRTEWDCEFVPGTQRTKMKASDNKHIKAIEDAIRRIQTELNTVFKELREYKEEQESK